jgi:hypothetical protein
MLLLSYLIVLSHDFECFAYHCADIKNAKFVDMRVSQNNDCCEVLFSLTPPLQSCLLSCPTLFLSNNKLDFVSHVIFLNNHSMISSIISMFTPTCLHWDLERIIYYTMVLDLSPLLDAPMAKSLRLTMFEANQMLSCGW